MSITAKELAAKLGISAAAVSMALNNKPGVSTQTRQKIKAAAKEMGYDFTRIEQKNDADKAIVFIIFKKHDAIVTDNPFFSEVIDGVFSQCRSVGFKLTIRYCYEPDANREYELLKKDNPDGIILLGTEMNKTDIIPFVSLGIPLVLLDAYYYSLNCDSVIINNNMGAKKATEYLIRQCKSQPGYICSSYMVSNFVERTNGFYQAIRDAGMSTSKSIVHHLSPTMEGAMSDMTAILEAEESIADCYFVGNDFMATGAIQAFKSYGLRVPEDVSVIGFDDVALSKMPSCSLTTVSVPKKELGATAVNTLRNRLKHPDSPFMKIEINVDLVIRSTVKKQLQY